MNEIVKRQSRSVLILTCILMASCFRSPHRLTEFEAELAFEGLKSANKALPLTHSLIPPITSSYLRNGGVIPSEIGDAITRNSGCDVDTDNCGNSDDPAICYLRLHDCGFDGFSTGGSFAIEQRGDGLSFCWGQRPEEEPDLYVDNSWLWGHTIATPLGDDVIFLQQTLLWSDDSPDGAPVIAQCGSVAVSSNAFQYADEALVGMHTLAVDPEDEASLTLEGELTWMHARPPFGAKALGGPSEDSCRDEGDCWEWTFSYSDTVFLPDRRLPLDGIIELEFRTPEADEATITFVDPEDGSVRISVAGGKTDEDFIEWL